MRHHRLAKQGVYLAAFLIITAGSLRASIDRGAIQGTITDQQGAVVPAAVVVVTNTATNVAVRLTTNADGFYLATQLVPGQYSVHVEAHGFTALNISNIRVNGGITTTANGQLTVGSTTQTVQVTAQAPLIQNTASNFTTPLATHYIQQIPLPGRDIQALMQLIPGITQSTGPSGSLFGFDSQFGGFPDPQHIVGSTISANGGQGGANVWYLDGTLNVAMGAENVVVNPSPDAVAEFNVVDNGLAPEYGFTSGAAVNVVLKSGTNQVHGDLYEFNRNSSFNASNPFDRRNAQGQGFLEPQVNFNNFGGTIGGPIYLPHIYNGKDKTFFFASWDISMLHEKKPTLLTVPLPAERNGDFSGDPALAPVCGVNGATNCLYNPYSTTGPDPITGQFSRTPFPTPVIPQNLIDPVAAFYVASYPSPNFLDPLQQGPGGCKNLCNNFIGTAGSRQTTHNVSVKIDHTLSDKNHLFGEWLFNPIYYTNNRYPWNGATAPTQTGINGAQPYRTINQIYTVGLTSTLTSTLVNEARVSFSRQNILPSLNPDSVTATSSVLKEIQGLNLPTDREFSPSPFITAGSLASFGPQPWQNALSGSEATTVLDDLTKILGKHTLKAGFMGRRVDGWYEDQCPLSLNFGGALTADPVTGLGGSGLAQFLLGAVDQGSGGCLQHHPYQTNYEWGMYGQDDFRVTPKLSLNIGLRWDIFQWPSERHNDVANWDLNAMNLDVPFKGRLVYFGTPQHPSSTPFPARLNDLGPRFGFAWSPFHDHATVIRGSYGIIYSDLFETLIALQDGFASQTAFSSGLTYNGDFTGQRAAFKLSAGAPPNNIPPPSLQKQQDEQFLGSGGGGIFRGSKDPYVEQWSFFIERQLPSNMMINVGYVGTHGTHLIGDSFRQIDYVPTATRLKLRNNINDPIPTNPALGAIYGCGTSCPASLVLPPWPQYTSISENVAADGFNDYNSFQMRFEKRYSQGLDLIAAYTIQKNIASENLGLTAEGNLSPTTEGNRALGRASFARGGFNNSGVLNEDPDNRNRYIALAPDDIPQVLNLAATYELPVGPGKRFLRHNGALSKIFGGWTLTQNWNFQSGIPLGFSAPCNAISCTPNLIGNPSAGQGSKNRSQLENQWFNPNAFEAPFGSKPTVIQEITTGLAPDGTPLNLNTLNEWWQFGNAGYRLGSARAPGFWNADMALSKDFHFTESRYFEFQWQVFNAFNHQSLGIPNTNWCLPPGPNGQINAIHQFGCQFGLIDNVQTDPRAMEFGLKFYW